MGLNNVRILKCSFDRFHRLGPVAGLLLFVLIGTAASLWLPESIAGQVYQGDDNDRFNRLVEEYRRAILELFGGFLLVSALEVGRRRAAAAEELARAGLRILDVTAEALATDRMVKAVAQLSAVDPSGAKQIELRLGGIYTLERIARESPDAHWPIMEILTAYLRRNAVASGLSHQRSETDGDLQGVITVLGRRRYKYDRAALNLRGITLPGLDLRGVQLADVDFSEASLEGAALVEAHLEGAILIGANLRDAQLTDAYLEGARLMKADLGGATAYRAHLPRAELTGANLQQTALAGAFLQKADFTRACLEGAKLAGAHLEDATLLDARLDQADLTRAYLHGANLAGALDLTQRQIDGAYGDGTTQLPYGLEYPPYWSSTTIHVPPPLAASTPSVTIPREDCFRHAQ
jgi:Pentapeptide repeats (8 copies)